MVPEMGAGAEGRQRWCADTGAGLPSILAPRRLMPRKHFWGWNVGRLALREMGIPLVYGCQGAPLSPLLIGYQSAVGRGFLPGLEWCTQDQGEASCFAKQGPSMSCSGLWGRDSWCAMGMTAHHSWHKAVGGPGDPRSLNTWLLGSPFKCFQLWQAVKEDLALQILRKNWKNNKNNNKKAN